MTENAPVCGPPRSRWLPAVVFSLFALLVLIEVVVIVRYGNYRNLIEEDGIEVSFTPEAQADVEAAGHAVEVVSDSRTVASDGAVLVEASEEGFEISAPGTLTIRFRAPDAGATVEFDYRFGRRESRARCEVALARVASRHGVDYMCRRSLVAKKRSRGKFRHYLADHAGWCELTLEVNATAAEVGFQVGVPELVWK